MSQILIFFKKANSLLLALLITISSMLGYFLFVGHPIWGTNDDASMSMIASGVLLSNEPSATLFFIHPFYGAFISNLYKWQPELPWYGICFVGILGLSLVTLNYSILRLRKDRNFSLIVICATIVTVLPSLWHLQFTIVSGLAVLAGLMLLISFFISKPIRKRSFFGGIVISLCLVIIGTMIRFESMLMVFMLLAPFVIVLLWQFALSSQNNKLKKLHIFKFLLIGMIICVSIVGLQIYNQKYYTNSPDLARWLSLNNAKSEFIDYGRIKYNEQTRNIFESVGWTNTDYDMIITWQYIDPIQYAPEKFIRVVEQVKKANYEKISFQQAKDIIENIISNRYSIKVMAESVPSLLICILVVGILIITWKQWNLLYVGSIIFATIALLLYLYVGLNRAPFRVLLLLCMGLLWMLLLVGTNFNKYSISKLRNSKIHKNWISVIIVFILFVSVYQDFSFAQKVVNKRVSQQNRLEDRVKIWTNNLPKDAIIYTMASYFPYQFHLPLKSFNYLYSLKRFIAGLTINQSPHQRKIINALGLNNDFYLSLAQKDNVYMVKSQLGIDEQLLNVHGKALRNYYKEKYGLELSLQDVSQQPYLYKMVFKKQNE